MSITSEEAKKILREIQANQKILSNCVGPHDFVDDPAAIKEHGWLAKRRKKCSKCQGTLNALEVVWYERGLAHGRKSK